MIGPNNGTWTLLSHLGTQTELNPNVVQNGMPFKGGLLPDPMLPMNPPLQFPIMPFQQMPFLVPMKPSQNPQFQLQTLTPQTEQTETASKVFFIISLFYYI